MSELVLHDLRGGYVELLSWLLDGGDPVIGRDGLTVERTGVTLTFPDPTQVLLPLGVNRRINARLAAVEALQLVSGTFDAVLIQRAAPTYTRVLESPDSLERGAYGPRLRYQLEQVYVELRDRPTSRRAVLSIWNEEDLYHAGDRPCTLSLQFLLRERGLELHVTMRSQDAWLGVPYDVFMFSQLQLSLAHQLGVGVGRYVHHVGSLHVYARDRDAAGMLVACPVDRPRPADYPTGVLPARVGDRFTETAVALVEGSFSEAEARANPWYVRQLAELGFVPNEVP